MSGNRAIALLMVVFVAFVFVPISVQAATSDVGAGMSAKFARGLTNTLTGFIEVPAQTIKGAKHGFHGIDTPQISHPLGAVAGMFTGFHHAAGRTLSGVSDACGFWAADYDSNDGYGLPLDDEYAWNEGKPHSMFDPNIKDGMFRPMGKKLVRGTGSALFSWMEFPGQMRVGFKESNPGAGLISGTFFSLSRLYGGISDAALFSTPNPVDTKGYAYTHDYPWDALAGHEKKVVEKTETAVETKAQTTEPAAAVQ